MPAAGDADRAGGAGEGARLAAAVSLVLASAKVRDHMADGDGLLARRPVAAAARTVARRWDRAGAVTGSVLGFDTAVLVDAVGRQTAVEAAAGPGTSLLTVTEPTETATAAAFGHTAVLAGRPGNRAPLEEAGRLFGRLAHLLDAVEDLDADAAAGAWNPLTATGTSLDEARRLCDDAVHGVRLALRDVEFTDGALAHVLLVHELRRSVDRAFGASCAHHPGPGGPGGPVQSPWLTPAPRTSRVPAAACSPGARCSRGSAAPARSAAGTTTTTPGAASGVRAGAPAATAPGATATAAAVTAAAATATAAAATAEGPCGPFAARARARARARATPGRGSDVPRPGPRGCARWSSGGCARWGRSTGPARPGIARPRRSGRGPRGARDHEPEAG